MEGGVEKEYPRIAGISSFGAGGSNAHVVVREYVSGPEAQVTPVTVERPALIVLSARDEERLKERAAQLMQYLERERPGDDQLPGIAYTLQVGREAMSHRIAFAAESVAALRAKLSRHCVGERSIPGFHSGENVRNKESRAEDIEHAINEYLTDRGHLPLLALWAKGAPIDWTRLVTATPPRRVPLPAYPFAGTPIEMNGMTESEDREDSSASFLTELIDNVIEGSVSVDDAISRVKHSLPTVAG
jgi:acyl transferase domain-containing protein